MANHNTKMPHHASASKHSGRKHVLHRMHIEKADNGGFSVEHHYKESGGDRDMMMSHKPSTTHVFKNHKDMLKHVGAAFGENGGHVDVADKTVGDESNAGEAETPTAQGA